MPYPLENLQYGLRRRLRELATRSEAYALQIAAPNYSGFQPIQKARSLAHTRFYVDEENNLRKILNPQQPKNSHETPLYIVSNKLTFNNITPGFQLSTILDDFLLAPKHLEFFDCHLNEVLIQSFVNEVNNPIERLFIIPCSFTNHNAAGILCNSPAFRALKSFVVEARFPTAVWWIKTFVEMKCTSLKEFIVYNAPLSVFEIDREVLFKFVKAQRKDFTLCIVMAYDVECHSTTEQRLNYLFDEHFERCFDLQYAQTKRAVGIIFDKEEYTHLCRDCVLRDD